jgi:steroid delta-isomerase-like uncharacterized protein
MERGVIVLACAVTLAAGATACGAQTVEQPSAAAVAAIAKLGEGITEIVWNQGHVERLGEFYADNVVRHVPESPDPIVGLEANKEYIRRLRAAFPDTHVDTERAFTDGKMAAVHWVWTGTHLGDMPNLPATGKKVRLPGISLIRVESGKFAEIWDQDDQLSLLVQLGVITLPSPPPRAP